MSQSAPDEVANNWGWFWVTTEVEVHNPYLFELTIPGGTTATVNEQIFEGETERQNQGTWTFTSSHWYHLTLSVNVPTATVKYQMKDKANGATVLEGTYTLRTGESPLMKGIYERNNRNGYDPGAILIDNVIITKADNASAIEVIRKPETAPAIFYDLTGRRLNGAPTRPGIYISNGKKVLY